MKRFGKVLWIVLSSIATILLICYLLSFFYPPIDAYLFGPKDGLDFGLLATTIALLSMIFAGMTLSSQRNTERNTLKITEESQRQILIDYIRHFYCNLIILNAIDKELADRFDTHYPAEEHLLKLKVDPESLHPAVFSSNSTRYNYIHELYLRMRNFNVEVDVAMLHLPHQNVVAEAKRRDLDTLIFKMSDMATFILKTMNRLWPDRSLDNFHDVRNMLWKYKNERNPVKSGEKKNIPTFDEFMQMDIPNPYTPKSSFYYHVLFGPNFDKAFDTDSKARRPTVIPERVETFANWLSYNIYAERIGLNDQGNRKIFIIPFKSLPHNI